MKAFKEASIGLQISLIRAVEFNRSRVGRHMRMWDIASKANYPKVAL